MSLSLELEGKRVLVTGGSGFLGSHLCERLLEQGHEVLCVDNFFSSARASALFSTEIGMCSGERSMLNGKSLRLRFVI